MIADLVVRVRGDVNSAVSDMGKVDKAFSGLAQGMQQRAGGLANTISTAVGFALGNMVTRFVSGLGQLAKTGLDFGRNMANVNSIAQLTDSQIQKLSKSVIELANDPRITDAPATIAAGLYDVVSSGFAANDALVIVKAGAMAATAGLTDTATATRAITAVLNAYSLGADQAGKVSDQLFQIVNLGVLSFPQLASTIGTVLPMANALGVSVDQLGAAYAVMTRQGVNADEATTQISAILTGLLKPTDAMTAGLQSMGYESGLALIQQKGLGGAVDVVNQIIQSGTGNIGDYVSNVRDMRGLLSLTKNDGKAYADMLDQMGHAQDGAGMTAKALTKQMESASFRIAKMRQEVQVTATLLIGALSPAIILVTAGLTKLLMVTLIPVANAFNDVSFAMMKAFDPGKGVNTILSQLPSYLQGIAMPLLVVSDNLGRFIRAMEGAFGAGKGLEYWMRGFPEPIRGVVHGLLLISDAFGDLVAAYHHGGLDEVLTNLPKKLDQIQQGVGEAVRGFGSAVADLVISGTVTLGGDLAKLSLGVAQWVMDQIGAGNWETLAIVLAPITLAPLLIYGAIKLGGDLANAQGHVWGWVKSQLYGEGAGGDPMLVGLPVRDAGTNIPIGTMIADGELRLSDYLQGIAGNLEGWVRGQLMGYLGTAGSTDTTIAGMGEATGAVTGGNSGITIPIGTLFIDAALKLADDLWGTAGNVYDWVTNQIQTVGRLGKEAAVNLAAVTVNVVSWAAGEIADLWSWLEGAVGVTASPVSAIPILGDTAAGSVSLTSVGVNVLAWAEGTWADITAWLDVQLNARGIDATLTDWTLSIGKPDTDASFSFDIIGFMMDSLSLNPASTGGDIGLPSDWNTKAQNLGQVIGKKLTELVISGITLFFESTGGGAGGGPSVTLTSVTEHLVAGLFQGIYDGIAQAVEPHTPAWLDHAWNWLIDPLTTGIKGVYDFLQGQPDWLKKLATGDVLGAIAAIFSAATSGSAASGGAMASTNFRDTISRALSNAQRSTAQYLPLPPGGIYTGNPLAAPLPGVTDLFRGTAGGGAVTAGTVTVTAGTVNVQAAQAAVKAPGMAGSTLPSPGLGMGGSLSPFLPMPAGGIYTGPPQQLSASSGSLDKVLDAAKQSLVDFSNQHSDAKLGADPSTFVRSLASTAQQAAAFARSDYDTTLGADISGVVRGLALAQLMGIAWSTSTYSANFNVDTSGIDSAIIKAQTAANIISAGQNVPGRAIGGTVTEGLTRIDEEGPELMRLPYGTLVYSARQTKAMMHQQGSGGGGTSLALQVDVTVQGDVNNVDDLQDRFHRSFLDEIVPVLTTVLERGRG